MMNTSIVVREYAHLKSGSHIQNNSLDTATIPSSAFKWLEQKAEDPTWSGVLKFKNAHTLVVKQYVGYIETPCGVGIEVLPKSTQPEHTGTNAHIATARLMLINMLEKVMGVTFKSTALAELNTRNKPIHEWIFTQFLAALKTIVLKGVRNDYERIEEESRFVRGQLDVRKQIANQLTGKAALFHIKHDVYTPNRLENRLLASALRMILRVSKHVDNIQLAHELNLYFADIPAEPNPLKVWHQWQKSRLLLHYEPIKPWCALILFGQNPEFMQGSDQGIALLFDMNKLFEAYVPQCLKTHHKVKEQAQNKYLLRDESNKGFFQLKPDLIIDDVVVADCKWKLIDAQQKATQYGSAFNISSSDLYQLGMHGLNYLPHESGTLILFYPENHVFKTPVSLRFEYNSNWKLTLIPFPLEWNAAAAWQMETWLAAAKLN